MSLSSKLILLTFGAVLAEAQSIDANVITHTVYTCSTSSRDLSLPTCGWVTSSSTTVPYCFTPSANGPPTTSITNSVTGSIASSESAVSTIASTFLTSILSDGASSSLSMSMEPLPASTTSSFATSTSVLTTLVTATTTSSAITPPTETPTYVGPPITSTEAVTSSELVSVTLPSAPISSIPSSSATEDLATLSSTPSSILTATSIVTASTTLPSSTLPATSSTSIPQPTATTGPCFSDGVLVNVNVTATNGDLDAYVLVCLSLSAGIRLQGGNLLAAIPVSNSADDCFSLCNATPGCNGFDFIGDESPLGAGPGTCELRGGAISIVATLDINLVAAVKLFLDLPSITCPSSSNIAYEADGGSDFIILCNTDYSYPNSDLTILPRTTISLAACIALCETEGPECVGVTYSASTLQCTLKGTMIPTSLPGVTADIDITSAIRASGPEGLVLDLGISLSSALGLVLNNGITGNLLPAWNSTLPEGSLELFADLDTVVDVTLNSPSSPSLSILFQEQITASARNAYFLTFRLALSASVVSSPFPEFLNVSLKVNILTTSGLVDIFEYNFVGGELETTRLFASGRMGEDVSLLTFVVESGDGEVPVRVVLDEIVFVGYGGGGGAVSAMMIDA